MTPAQVIATALDAVRITSREYAALHPCKQHPCLRRRPSPASTAAPCSTPPVALASAAAASD